MRKCLTCDNDGEFDDGDEGFDRATVARRDSAAALLQ
jgi:hypothetical protein